MFVHPDKKVLERFVSDNGLEMSVALVDSADELVLQLSLRELNGLAENVGLDRDFNNEEDAGMNIWSHISSDFGEYPRYEIGKSKLKQPDSEQEEKRVRKSKPKKEKVSRKRKSNVDYTDSVFVLGETDVRRNTAKGALRTIIEENLGEASYKDLLEGLEFEFEYDEKKSNGYIKSALNKGIIGTL